MLKVKPMKKIIRNYVLSTARASSLKNFEVEEKEEF